MTTSDPRESEADGGPVPPVPDFEPLLVRVVGGLGESSAATRHEVYERARAALDRGPGAPPGGGGLAAERSALEGAIARVEAASSAEAPPAPAAPAPPMDERRRFAFNAGAGAAANMAKVGVQLLLLPVMARLLGPAEFGLYALALPTIVFLTTLADGGLGSSLAREKEASTAVWSTAFWALLGSCSLLALVAVGSGFVLADLSHQPRLTGLMALLSLSFPLLALTALPAARLVRRGNLLVHSLSDITSTVIGAVTAIALALAGAGAWALAIQYIVVWTTNCAVLNAFAFERPTFEFRPSALRTHAATGGSLIGSRLSELVGKQAENLLFGRLFGTAGLGSFTFANQSSRFLCEAAGNPLWGALYSHALREEPARVGALHGTLSRLLASALFPASALLAASAPQVFDALLGPRWAGAAALVQILVPFYALTTVAGQCGALLLAGGRNAALFWALTGLSAGRVLAFALGPFGGPVAIAWGIGAANAAFAVAMLSIVDRETGAGPWAPIRELLPPWAAAGAAGLVCHALLACRPESPAWTAACLLAGAATFVAGLSLVQGRRLLSDAFAIRRIVFARR